MYNRFLLEQCFARTIVSQQEQERRERGAGYVEGKRPATGPPRPEIVGPQLTRYTLAAAAAIGSAPPPAYDAPPPAYGGPPPAYGGPPPAYGGPPPAYGGPPPAYGGPPPAY
jgi:hypothetical protein